MENKKTIVISGGTSGIGLATAKLLIAEGYQVVLIGRNKEKGEAALAQLEANSTQAYFIAADVSKDYNMKHLNKFSNYLPLMFGEPFRYVNMPYLIYVVRAERLLR